MLSFFLVFLAQLPPHLASQFDQPSVIASTDGHLGAAVVAEISIVHGEGDPPGPDQVVIRVGSSDLKWRRPLSQQKDKDAEAAVNQLEKAGVPPATARVLVATAFAKAGLVGWVSF